MWSVCGSDHARFRPEVCTDVAECPVCIREAWRGPQCLVLPMARLPTLDGSVPCLQCLTQTLIVGLASASGMYVSRTCAEAGARGRPGVFAEVPLCPCRRTCQVESVEDGDACGGTLTTRLSTDTQLQPTREPNACLNVSL